jgi:hypothetical protein
VEDYAAMSSRLSIPILALLFCLAASVFSQTAAAPPGPGPAIESEAGLPVASGNDPIAVVAHGAIFDANMKQIDPTPEFLRNTLDLYIKRLTGEANDEVRATLDKHREVLAEEFGMDEMTPRFLILDYLTGAMAPRDQAYLEVRNHAMRAPGIRACWAWTAIARRSTHAQTFPTRSPGSAERTA